MRNSFASYSSPACDPRCAINWAMRSRDWEFAGAGSTSEWLEAASLSCSWGRSATRQQYHAVMSAHGGLSTCRPRQCSCHRLSSRSTRPEIEPKLRRRLIVAVVPGGDARSELHLHCISTRSQSGRPTLRGSMELHYGLLWHKALRGAPARPGSSGHRTEETPTPCCAIGSPYPEQSAMACRPMTLHMLPRRTTQLLNEGQLRVLTTVPMLYKWTSPLPSTRQLRLVLCRPSLPVQRDPLPYDAAIRGEHSEQIPKATSCLGAVTQLLASTVGGPTCSSSLDPTITSGRGRSMHDEPPPLSIPSWEFSMQD